MGSSPPCHLRSAGKVESLLCVARAGRQAGSRACTPRAAADRPSSVSEKALGVVVPRTSGPHTPPHSHFPLLCLTAAG